MRKVSALDVARAITKVYCLAGQTCDSVTPESAEQRAKNLLKKRKYGCYIEKGDPHQHSQGYALVTIYLEPNGGENDCYPPLDYYENGVEVASRADELLRPRGAHIEFINAAVAAVFED
jgi:hypothetical protein